MKLGRAHPSLQAGRVGTLGRPPPKCFSHFRFPGCFESTGFISFITKARHAMEKTHPVLRVLPHFLPEIDQRRPWSTLHTSERHCCACGRRGCLQTKLWLLYGQSQFFSRDLSPQPQICSLFTVNLCSLCTSFSPFLAR